MATPSWETKPSWETNTPAEEPPSKGEAPKKEETSGINAFLTSMGVNTPAAGVGIAAGEAAGAATANPLVGAGVGLVVGGLASFITPKMLEEIEGMGPEAQYVLQQMGIDKASRAQKEQEHPYASAAGGMMNPFMSPSGTAIQRAAGAAFNVGVDAGSQLAQTGTVDPAQSAIAAGTGAAFPGKLNKLGQKLPGVEPEAKAPDKLDPTPHVERWASKEVPERLAQAAHMDKDGVVIPAGKGHSDELKAKGEHKEGFLTNKGRFVDRQEAIPIAKEQHGDRLQKEPDPEEGLHTTDFGPNRLDAIQHTTPDHMSVSPENFDKVGQEIMWNKGKEEATKFAQDYLKYNHDLLVDVPTQLEKLSNGEAFHDLGTKTQAEESDRMVRTELAEKDGVTPEMRSDWVRYAEGKKTLSADSKAKYEEHMKSLDKEVKALAKRLQDMGIFDKDMTLNPNHVPRVKLSKPSKETFWGKMFKDESPMNEHMEKETGAVLERGMFVITHNGKRKIVQVQEDGIYIWSKKDNPKAGESPYHKEKRWNETIENPNEGKETSDGFKLEQANIDELHENTPYRYMEDHLYSSLTRLNEMRKFIREAQFLKDLTTNEGFLVSKIDTAGKPNGIAIDIRNNPQAQVPKGWKAPKYYTKIPQLSGYVFEPRIAEVIEDYSKKFQPNWWNKMSGFLIKTMMLNPLPHIDNEFWHLWNARGITGWITPAGLKSFYKTVLPALRDVKEQTDFMREALREGASINSLSMRTNEAHRNITDKAVKEASNDPVIKSKFEMIPDAFNKLSGLSNKYMWIARDTMYMQQLHEHVNHGMSMRDAVREVERHMPNYQLPPRVLGSRALQEVLANPNVSVFSRYHYGMIRSLAETGGQLTGRLGKEEFAKGVNTLAAIGVGIAIQYEILDKLAEMMFGEGAESRKAGPYHFIHAIQKVATGDRDISYMLWPIFTFNPMLLSTLQLVWNRNLYTGKGIYRPDAPAVDIAQDLGKYTMQNLPQVSTALRAHESEGGVEQFLAKQIDIDAPSEKQMAMRKRAMKRRAASLKGKEKRKG
jgi:hypothetical protein